MSNPPFVAIENIPLVAQPLVWSLTPGPMPYSTTVKVPITDNENFLALENPVKMRWEFESSAGGEIDQKVIEFENLYLHDPRVVSEFYVMWKISDCRFKLRGKKLFYGKNLTRVRNEVGTITPPTTEKIGETNAALLRQPFDTIKRGRYLTNSLRDFEGIKGNSPLKVSEVLREVLEKAGIDVDLTGLQDGGDYVLENMIAEGEDIYRGLADLLGKNRLQMGITRSGKIKVYSIDFFDDGNIATLAQVQDQAKISPGRIYKQNLKNIRPKKVVVMFEKLQEVKVKDVPHRVLFPEGPLPENATPLPGFDIRPDQPINVPVDGIFQGNITAQDVAERRAIACVNVIRVPFVPSNLPGVFNIGEYIPMQDYLSVIGITDEQVRKTWFNSFLEIFLKLQLNTLITNNDPLVNMIAGAIRQHYRQIYQIDPAHMDNIKDLQDRRCTIIDNWSGMRPPSPLWADFCWFPRGRNIELARGNVVDKTHATNVIIDEIDPNRERPTPGTINIVDRDLGIFSVSYPSVSDTMIASVVPSALDPGTVPAATPSLGGNTMLAGSVLKENHTMETIVSVLWHYDRDGNFDSRESEQGKTAKYFDFIFDFENQLGESLGPDIEFLSRKEYARVDLEGIITNGEVLTAIARAEAAKIYNQFRDRFVGKVDLPEFVDVPLNGNVKSVTFAVADGVGPRTIVDMMEIPPSPDLAQILPDHVRRYMLKQIDPGGG